MERQQQIIPVRVSYICDSCGVGEMELDDTVFRRHSSRTPHSCSRCGHSMIFHGEVYPRIDYVDAMSGKGAESVNEQQRAAGIAAARVAMEYAFWCSDKRASEIKDALRVVFGDDIIAAAIVQMTGGANAVVETLGQTISREEFLAADRQAREEIANFLGTTLKD